MANNQAMSPQGYNIENNPYNENPFWEQEQGEVAATVDVGTVRTETIDAGLPASVEIENVGSPQQAELDFRFSIPKGDKGDKGDTGERGPRGFQGPRGLDSTVPGPIGSRGEKGERGERGEQGAPGRDGVTPVINVSASILPIGGQPNVQVTSSGTPEEPRFKFIFSGLSGGGGETGASFERIPVENGLSGRTNIDYPTYTYNFLKISFYTDSGYSNSYSTNLFMVDDKKFCSVYTDNEDLYFIEYTRSIYDETRYALTITAIYSQNGHLPANFDSWHNFMVYPYNPLMKPWGTPTEGQVPKIVNDGGYLQLEWGDAGGSSGGFMQWTENESFSYDIYPYKEYKNEKVELQGQEDLNFLFTIRMNFEDSNNVSHSVDITISPTNHVFSVGKEKTQIVLDNAAGTILSTNPSEVSTSVYKYIDNDTLSVTSNSELYLMYDEGVPTGSSNISVSVNDANMDISYINLGDEILYFSSEPDALDPTIYRSTLTLGLNHATLEFNYNGEHFYWYGEEFLNHLDGGGNMKEVTIRNSDNDTDYSDNSTFYNLAAGS